MHRSRYIIAVLLLAAVLALGRFAWRQQAATPVKDPVSLETRLAQELPTLAALEERYTGAGRFDDLSLDAVAVLDRLLGVAAVHTNGVKNPTARIVHFLDYHFVKKDDLALEFPKASAAELYKMHQDLLLGVALVQVEQEAALRCLAKHHGLADAWLEGLTPEAVPAYLERADYLRKLNANVEPVNRVPDHKLELLQLGSLTDVFLSGHLAAVLPLDVAADLDAAKTLEPVEVKARDAGIAARLLKAKGACQVIVLGGAHDLGPHLPAGVEYLRVEVLSYREFAGQ